ncbi:MAG: hypothetical protein JO351_04500 [Candidatus Eremiobacteraeota bacterium]|nr:hypothetical protein [Candidatus Eremiobacteraeota bacterium]
MSEFVYLYRGGSRPESPNEGQQVMQKWVNWLGDLERKGHIKDKGQPLDGQGKVVRDGGNAVTDGPYAESKDIVGGYTLVEAKDLSQAAELANGCPILERGGLVEVRPVMEM